MEGEAGLICKINGKGYLNKEREKGDHSESFFHIS